MAEVADLGLQVSIVTPIVPIAVVATTAIADTFEGSNFRNVICLMHSLNKTITLKTSGVVLFCFAQQQ